MGYVFFFVNLVGPLLVKEGGGASKGAKLARKSMKLARKSAKSASKSMKLASKGAKPASESMKLARKSAKSPSKTEIPKLKHKTFKY